MSALTHTHTLPTHRQTYAFPCICHTHIHTQTLTLIQSFILGSYSSLYKALVFTQKIKAFSWKSSSAGNLPGEAYRSAWSYEYVKTSLFNDDNLTTKLRHETFTGITISTEYNYNALCTIEAKVWCEFLWQAIWCCFKLWLCFVHWLQMCTNRFMKCSFYTINSWKHKVSHSFRLKGHSLRRKTEKLYQLKSVDRQFASQSMSLGGWQQVPSPWYIGESMVAGSANCALGSCASSASLCSVCLPVPSGKNSSAHMQSLSSAQRAQTHMHGCAQESKGRHGPHIHAVCTSTHNMNTAHTNT